VGILAIAFFALGLGDQPFVDEYAYITQSYQPDLLIAGRVNDRAWLDRLTYDLVPLPKYLINGAYRLAGIRRPRPRDAAAWYDNTSYQWGGGPELLVARLPSVLMGAVGCVALFALGVQLRDPLAGWLAAGLLMLNPLYRLHAHRAMSEPSCEALSLIALGLAFWAWNALLTRRTGLMLAWVSMAAAGLVAGLAILAKFNGILVLLVLAGWMVLGLVLPSVSAARKITLLAATLNAPIIAAATFVALNPFMTAHPAGPLPPGQRAVAALDTWERFRFLVQHRMNVSRNQQAGFSHNALLTLADRATVLAIQGFGRFGPLGPTRSNSVQRYDVAQDLGALFWLPLVLASLLWSILRGIRELRSGEPPLDWLVAIWAFLALGMVGSYLPMAWDRYQLPIQAPAALLVALALADWTRSFGPRRLFSTARP
jgi:4-amino-4-deoxy-L-arabinose transferase-like glycosyltransferase